MEKITEEAELQNFSNNAKFSAPDSHLGATQVYLSPDGGSMVTLVLLLVDEAVLSSML